MPSPSKKHLRPDPIGQAGGLNLYAYVLNDPVNFIDPYGLTMRDAYKGGIFEFKAASVVMREAAKIVATDVALTLTNYVPLLPIVSFWTGRGLNGYIINNNFVGLQQTAIQVLQEIQKIRDEVFSDTDDDCLPNSKNPSPSQSGMYWGK